VYGLYEIDSQLEVGCESAWKIDPLTGDIGVQK
jgi:hypothetical protein